MDLLYHVWAFVLVVNGLPSFTNWTVPVRKIECNINKVQIKFLYSNSWEKFLSLYEEFFFFMKLDFQCLLEEIRNFLNFNSKFVLNSIPNKTELFLMACYWDYFALMCSPKIPLLGTAEMIAQLSLSSSQRPPVALL